MHTLIFSLGPLTNVHKMKAFSSYTDDGKTVVHMLNSADRYTKTGKPIPPGAACYPIRLFLEEYAARGFTPVPLKVNGR